MVKRMLIDANHPEETRAVVLDDRHLADFDFETSTKLQLKGNIYLAKVTRVEPSLQAAFVDYGGNRHGFLAFSEIHPDYYQIPQADRALLEENEREAATKPSGMDGEAEGEAAAETITNDADEETAEVVAEQARRRARLLRSYKIQEVIKRRQIMLVQVVKEERGNKGAALTTYLSLAGRYCVLMPNTPRGGGISRKIVQAEDRRKLKQIAHELEVPAGMGLIIRTAGQERNKSEIKRDYEYLLRLWNEVRETTLQSIAPKLIYEEGDLIKRAMRDLYTRDIEEVLVEGEEGYRSAKRLMSMLMPSRARLVKLYKDEEPLFFRYRVEDQLDAMHSPVVQLASGGSIVIHTTEALTAIDVNSGRSTRERHIDETAVKTNLEAADEVARQLRLRDLAGLIVIDFIDMAEGRHQRAVEKRLREALKADRARIQMGKISQFGLLELSRQRLRASLQELSSQVCPHCAGLGVVRSTESCALQALRAIQEAGIRRDAAILRVTLPGEVALYLLNQKREAVSRLEHRYAMRVLVHVDAEMVPPSMRLEVLEKRERIEARAEQPEAAPQEEPAEEREHHVQPARAAEPAAQSGAPGAEESDEAGRRRRKRRRRRRRPSETGAPSELVAAGAMEEPEAESVEAEEEVESIEPQSLPPAVEDVPTIEAAAEEGRVPTVEAETMPGAAVEGAPETVEDVLAAPAPSEPPPATDSPEEEAAPKKRRRTRKPRVAAEAVTRPEAVPEQASRPVEGGGAPAEITAPEPPPPSTANVGSWELERQQADSVEVAGESAPVEPDHATLETGNGAQRPEPAVETDASGEAAQEPAAAEAAEPEPPRTGWWSRWVR